MYLYFSCLYLCKECFRRSIKSKLGVLLLSKLSVWLHNKWLYLYFSCLYLYLYFSYLYFSCLYLCKKDVQSNPNVGVLLLSNLQALSLVSYCRRSIKSILTQASDSSFDFSIMNCCVCISCTCICCGLYFLCF